MFKKVINKHIIPNIITKL